MRGRASFIPEGQEEANYLFGSIASFLRWF